MGRYDPRALFEKEPAVIAGALKSILWVLVLVGLVSIGEQQLAAIALTLEIVLGLFVRNQSTPVAAPTLKEGTGVSNPAKPGGDEPPPDLIVAKRSDLTPDALANAVANEAEAAKP